MKKDVFDVRNKVVIITGGLGQLGRQFSLSLLERGAKVVVFDIQADEQKISERFGKGWGDHNLIFFPADITLRDSVEEGLKMVVSKWGVPHALINNAALDSPPNSPIEENGPFETYPGTSWDKVMQVNVKGTFICCQVIGGQMAYSGGGSIINICSTYGIVGPDQRIYEYRSKRGEPFYKPAAYSASKSAIVNFTRYCATYWAGKNVRVNTLTFGGVFNNQDDNFLKGYCDRVPLGRMAREDEYNGAIIFLISDASSYMTGSNMIIDGGWTAW
jgi:NAD(P)-dependent dehydrogenase (short-subunit alcohol dehydrogenase family)